ncbi:MAG: arginine--tRNA ligase [Clostridia bacterium]|nr:arginine--tRNA ligase [Clostridia bacterium]
MSVTKYLNELLKDTFEKIGYEVEGKLVSLSDRPDLSQFQCNTAFTIAKENRKNPREIAGKIVDALREKPIFKDLSVAGPGFINITLNDEFITNYIRELSKDSKIRIQTDEHKNILIDYGGANIAKPLHVGHLRSAIIGEGLKRLSRVLGHNAIGDVHLGDWGRQMGLVISEIKHRNPELVYFDEGFQGDYPSESPVTINDLEEIYPTASIKAKNDPVRLEEAREATAILQNKHMKGHRGYYALWLHLVRVSIEDLKESYGKFDVTFELWKGESDTNEIIPEVINIFEEKGLVEESEGALIVKVEDLESGVALPPLILRTQNDSVGYHATEVATIYQRVKDFNLDEIWYVVDNRQELHFKQVFSAVSKAGITPPSLKLRFIGFGTMNGKDGRPFKTRDGGLMKLSDLSEIVEKEIFDIMKMNNKNEYIEDSRKVAKILANATIKYADALSYRTTDYIFDIEKFIATQGKTGSYILYSTVRINSLLRKAMESGIGLGELKIPTNEFERSLMLSIIKLQDILDTSFDNKSLTEIADYLYELNSAYNNFYSNCKILGNSDIEKQESWLTLSEIVGNINKILLGIMAIDIPEAM